MDIFESKIRIFKFEFEIPNININQKKALDILGTDKYFTVVATHSLQWFF